MLNDTMLSFSINSSLIPGNALQSKVEKCIIYLNTKPPRIASASGMTQKLINNLL